MDELYYRTLWSAKHAMLIGLGKLASTSYVKTIAMNRQLSSKFAQVQYLKKKKHGNKVVEAAVTWILFESHEHVPCLF
jgi:hypothetical protein